MKQTFTFFTFIFASIVAFSQAPNAMSYQAVIRDANNNLVSNQSIGIQISILQGSSNGSSVYTEIQTASTNDNGLVSLIIGEGTTSDEFSSIDWANGPYFIKTETDPTGGISYTITGTSQLLSVPYALHSKTAENTFSGDYNDLSNAPDLTNYDQDASDDFDGDYNSLVNNPTLATVATTGDYNDLSNQPNIPQNISDLTNDVGYVTDLYGSGAFTHYIGEEFEGGVIFYLWKDSQGEEHGLIVDKIDLSNSEQEWSNIGNQDVGINSQSIWDGLSNSNAIVTQMGHISSAASLCLNSTNGGKNDWYLPSAQELYILWNNYYTVRKSLIQILDATEMSASTSFPYYWSSTELYSNTVNVFSFLRGSSFRANKEGDFGHTKTLAHVRAIRTF